jgi:lipopolysaccharide export system permease protein
VQITLIFDRLSEAIALLAAMFTIAWMQRSNEQMPLLSAGVSTHRIVAPVVGCAFFMILVSLVNQELLVPAVADRLTLSRDDPGGQKEVGVRHAYDPSGIHVTGLKAVRHGRIVHRFECLIPDGLGEAQEHICAQEARVVSPADVGAPPGSGACWLLTGCHPKDIQPIPGILLKRDRTRYILCTRTIDFDSLTREPNWFLRTSTWQLYQELQRPESQRLASMAVLFHTRLTRPLLGFVLVLMGLSVILRDQNRNVFISAGMCLVLCGVFFASCTACKMLGDKELLTPALAAWLPVIVFGPFAFVLFEAAHT